MSSPLETNNDGVITAAPAEVQWLAAAAADGQKPPPRRFQMTAYTGGPMQLAGWRYPVVVDLSGLQATAKPKVFLEHDRTQRVGHIEQVQANEAGLVVGGVVSSTGKAAQEVIADAAAGFPWQASIGARATQVEWVPEGKSATANGRTFPGPVNIARASVLGEVSFVALGADDATSALIAANAALHKEHRIMDENKTPTAGNPQATSTQATAAASAPITALATPAPLTTPTPAEQMRAEAAAEATRIAAVRKACGGKHGEIEAKAIAEGWDAMRTELEVLRANRPSAPTTQVRSADQGGI